MHNCAVIADNNVVENFIVYGVCSLYFLSVLPVYVSVYAYADSSRKYASANFCLYRIFRFLSVDTDDGGKLRINGKVAGFNPAEAIKDGKIVFDNLCVFKVIQLSDFGLKSDSVAYAALLQSAATFPVYSYISKKGSACKLKNYVILNEEHGDIMYSAKVVSVINLITALKILFILLLERINEN